jgi:hypothetical protein
MGNLYNNNYFKSSDIKVFPSSFRGEYDWGVEIAPATLVFDPEARLNTEANFILPKNALGKTSYIFNYNQTEDKIAFFLNGYYFEILNVSKYLSELANRFVGIKLREITLQEETAENTTIKYDSERKTKILDSWEPGSSDLLDYAFEEKQYYFTGLKVLAENETGANYMLKLFIATTDSPPEIVVNQEELLPNINHGSRENTFLHGTGLIAGYNNQTVIGRYNTNHSDTLFEVGGGTGNDSSLRKTMFAVTPTETRITVDTKINGNTSIEGTTVDVTGKFTVVGDTSITGNTAIEGNTIDLTGQTKIIGNTSIKGDTSIEGDTSIIGSTEIIANEGKTINLTGPTTIVGATSITGATKIDGDTTVDGTTINIKGTNVNIDGITTITGPLAVSEKVASASTVATDLGKTLTTKDYVDNRIDSLDFNSLGANGKFIKTIQQTDGKITATTGDFKTTLSNDDKESHSTAPTTGAVVNYVNDKINSLDVSAVGGSGAGQYISGISQENGKISADEHSFSNDLMNWVKAQTDSSYKAYLSKDWSKNIGAPRESAVFEFAHVVAANEVSTFKMGTELQQIIINTIYPIGSIYTYIGDKSKLDEEASSITTTGTQPKCPITVGKWELIESGRFLCSGNNSKGSTYEYKTEGNKGGSANAALIKHNHTYSSDYTENTSTNHTHELSVPCSKAGTGKYTGFEGNAGDLTSNMSLVTMVTQAPGVNKKFGWMCGGNSDGSNSGIGGDVSGLFNPLYGNPGSANKALKSDNHNHKLPSISEAGSIDESANANLPPYIIVYMWKRIQ